MAGIDDHSLAIFAAFGDALWITLDATGLAKKQGIRMTITGYEL
jgi:hypothetical protein